VKCHLHIHQFFFFRPPPIRWCPSAAPVAPPVVYARHGPSLCRLSWPILAASTCRPPLQHPPLPPVYSSGRPIHVSRPAVARPPVVEAEGGVRLYTALLLPSFTGTALPLPCFAGTATALFCPVLLVLRLLCSAQLVLHCSAICYLPAALCCPFNSVIAIFHHVSDQSYCY